MALTPAQNALIKADIIAKPDLAVQPNNADGNIEIARLYNLPSNPVVKVWATNAKVSDISDAIQWDKFTPVDAADETNIYTNRLLLIQTKQINLQSLLQGRTTVDASKPNVRAGLRDAVIALPAGVAGAAVSAGGVSGVNVLNACLRTATRLEALLSTGAAPPLGGVTADIMGFEGAVGYQAIETARI